MNVMKLTCVLVAISAVAAAGCCNPGSCSFCGSPYPTAPYTAAAPGPYAPAPGPYAAAPGYTSQGAYTPPPPAYAGQPAYGAPGVGTPVVPSASIPAATASSPIQRTSATSAQ